jgi:general secretion pathway protein H
MVLMAFQAAKVMTPISGAKPLRQPVHTMKQYGFTLLELLIVLSIIVIASAIVIPNINGTESNLLTAQVRQTASAFNFARRIAIVEGAPQVATLFQMDVDDPDYPDIRGDLLRNSNVPILENFTSEISYQADINEDPEVLEIIEIVFYPQGGSTGGILNFKMGDLTARIRIDSITGRINTYYAGEEIEEDL